jgi:hypothetical protein
MITENVGKVLKIYHAYGRGSLSWDDGMRQLFILGIDREIAARVLLGRYPIAGQ